MGRPRQRSDEDVLEAVRAVVMRRGPGASSKVLAAAAGVSEGVLFQRFGTKSALVYAALRMPDLDVEALLLRATAARESGAESNPGSSAGVGTRAGLEELALGALVYLRQMLACMLPLFYFPQPEHLDEIAHGEHSALPRLTGAITAFLEQEQRRGRLRSPNPRATAMLLLSSMHTVAMMEHIHGPAASDHAASDSGGDTAQVRELVQALWDGLVPVDTG